MPTNIPSYRVSSYLDYLPALFQPETGAPNFVGRFLLAFEKILVTDGALAKLAERTAASGKTTTGQE